ncbi:MAG: DNA methyltransferase [Desulfobacterales bacterium]
MNLYAKQTGNDTGISDGLLLMEKQDKNTERYLKTIATADKEAYNRFESVIKTDNNINRQIVSFQANKSLSAYRWYKYKEAFSCELVKYLLSEYHIPKGIVFDPFAGSGTALFAASEMSYDSEGIELLPLGQQIVKSRITADRLEQNEISRIVFWKTTILGKNANFSEEKINSLRITAGAYPGKRQKDLYSSI